MIPLVGIEDELVGQAKIVREIADKVRAGEQGIGSTAAAVCFLVLRENLLTEDKNMLVLEKTQS